MGDVGPDRSGRAATDEPRAGAPAEDLRALRVMTARELTSLERSAAAARRRAARKRQEETFMSKMGAVKRKPWLATAIAGGLAAVALLVIPISYERTAGHDVALTIAGPSLGSDEVRDIARELKGILGAGPVGVEARQLDGETSFVFKASVPTGSRVDARATADAFAAELVNKGYAASAVTTPKKERVSGTVYAYARDRVIRISTDGKSAAQLEAEVRQRLADAGLPDAQVSVQDLGHNRRQINIEAKREVHGDQTAEEMKGELPLLELTKDGMPLGGKGLAIRVAKRKDPSGATSMELKVMHEGREVSIQVPNAESMSDAALSAEIESQLRQAGLDLKVTVTNGKVKIEPNK